MPKASRRVCPRDRTSEWIDDAYGVFPLPSVSWIYDVWSILILYVFQPMKILYQLVVAVTSMLRFQLTENTHMQKLCSIYFVYTFLGEDIVFCFKNTLIGFLYFFVRLLRIAIVSSAGTFFGIIAKLVSANQLIRDTGTFRLCKIKLFNILLVFAIITSASVVSATETVTTSTLKREQHNNKKRDIHEIENESSNEKSNKVCEDSKRQKCIVRNVGTRHYSYRVGSALTDVIENVDLYSLGKMNVCCNYCGALGFKGENKGTLTKPYFGEMCCDGGKVDVQVARNFELHPYLKELLTSYSAEATHFRKNSRMFNAGMAFASVAMESGSKDWGRNNNGYSALKISGQLVRRIGPMLPRNGMKPKFMQTYFFEPGEATMHRMSNFEHDDPRKKEMSEAIFRKLHVALMEAGNRYINECMGVKEYVEKHYPAGVDDLTISIQVGDDATPDNSHIHLGRLNKPTVNEVSILFPNDVIDESRQIVLNLKQPSDWSGVKRIPDTHGSYDPLSYPLFFNKGQDGWYPKRMHLGNKITMMGWVSFMLMERVAVGASFEDACYQPIAKSETERVVNPIHLSNKIGSQFIIDQWAKLEAQKLRWLERNQKKIRAELYSSLHDAVKAGDDSRNNLQKTGRPTILPASHTGSSRYMHEKFMDSMAICRRYGRPDLFVTMTCNPDWKEIADQLIPGQQALDRPDLCCRVFKLKLNEMMKDFKGGRFGKYIAHTYSIEFQKRGYPHAHILFWFEGKHYIGPDKIDKLICAEIPDEKSPIYERVTKSMIHGPGCSVRKLSCCANGSCKYNYPHDYQLETAIEDDNYPLYRRRPTTDPDGHSFEKYINKIKYVVTNADVTAYNPWLLKKFDCHINVEYCHSVKSIKYLFKYITKGSDQATITLERKSGESPQEQGGNDVNPPQDEIKQYKTRRYISSVEACWRFFEFDITSRCPTVEALPVHLENGQTVYFDPNNPDETEEKLEKNQRTKLTEYFCMCEKKMDGSQELYYHEMPEQFVWEKSKRIWSKRKKGFKIGRMHAAHPSNPDRFYLRLLLNHIKGAESFEHLKTLDDGTVCETFQAACIAKNLTSDDKYWHDCLDESVLYNTNIYQLRELFASLLLECGVSNPVKLYDKFKGQLSADFSYHYNSYFRGGIIPQMLADDEEWDVEKIALNASLCELERKCMEKQKSTTNFGLPLPDFEQELFYRAILGDERDIAVSKEKARRFHDKNSEFMNEDQTAALNCVMQKVDNKEGGLIFLDAPGGTGKTFLLNVLASRIRMQDGKVAATATSGIAATLLHEGRTGHNMFKLPVQGMHNKSFCSISAESELAQFLRDMDIAIIDEGPMWSKLNFECLDRTLRDLTGKSHEKFGGKLVLVSGDFRQILPIIPKGRRAVIVESCLKRSKILWDDTVLILRLSKNMRVLKLIDAYPDDTDFHEELRRHEQWLLELGEGRLPSPPDCENMIDIPGHMVKGCREDVIDEVFGNLENHIGHPDYFKSRAILAADNMIVNETNIEMVNRLPGELCLFQSIDSVSEDDKRATFPVEYLNTLEPSGLAEHELHLKVGAPVILLRNFNVKAGHCNGTRYIIKAIGKYRLVLEKLEADEGDENKILLMPRIPMQYDPKDQPFCMTRLQFPIKLAFAITFQRSQGQSFEQSGVLLPRSVWTHGQLYVALSRCGNPRNIHVWADQDEFKKFSLPKGKVYTKNIVYHEIL